MLEQENLDHICTIKNCHPIFGQEIRHRRIIVKSNKDVFAVYFQKMCGNQKHYIIKSSTKEIVLSATLQIMPS